MNLSNYDQLTEFVKDNFDKFESDNKVYSIANQKKAFKEQNKNYPNYFHTSNLIKAEIKKISKNCLKEFKDKEKSILDEYRQCKYDKKETVTKLKSTYRYLSINKLLTLLTEKDKKIDIIFTEEHFTNPKATFDEIDNIQTFVRNNLVAFNAKPTRFNKNNIEKYAKGFNNKSLELHYKSDIERYLKKQFFDLDRETQDAIYDYYKNNHTISETVKKFSKELTLNERDIKNFLTQASFKELKNEIENNQEIVDELVTALEKKSDLLKKEYISKNIKTDLKNIISRFLPLILSNGFPANITNVDSGIMVANAGDSAQFIFIARAILAGFDSSNVDVRSSRYDCIVDYKKRIFRVQVKGISQDTVHYKDRDRGGKGNTHSASTNKGRKITAEDCDIYAAVDKKTGVIYLIPIEHLESDENKNSENIKNLVQFREYWGIFEYLINKNSDN